MLLLRFKRAHVLLVQDCRSCSKRYSCYEVTLICLPVLLYFRYIVNFRKTHLLLPLVLQSSVGFGFLNQTIPSPTIQRQFFPITHSQHLQVLFTFLWRCNARHWNIHQAIPTWEFIASVPFLQSKVFDPTPKTQLGRARFLFRSCLFEPKSSLFGVQGTRLHPTSFATSDDTLSGVYPLEVRVGFISSFDHMKLISRRFSVFARLAHLASARLSETNISIYSPPPSRPFLNAHHTFWYTRQYISLCCISFGWFPGTPGNHPKESVPSLSSPPSRLRNIGGGMETPGKISQFEVTENSLFYCSQTT